MTTKFGIIGCGNMGSAILRGVASRDDLELLGTDVDEKKMQALAQEIGLKAMGSIRELMENADVVLLAVKPHQIKALLKENASRIRPSQILISIAAGIKLEQLLKDSCGTCPVVRVMPNTPAMVNQGVFAVCLDDPNLKDAQKEFVTALFKPLGQVHVLAEKDFDAFTAVVGSGPAYVFYFMEALVESAVALGLPRDQADEMVRGLLLGSSVLAKESGQHLGILREMVTSPGGTTIAATNVMDSRAVRGAIIEAVKASYKRSVELGE